MKKIKFAFKKDHYRQARGGYSRFLSIYCSVCKNFILLYQKDGPGILKRLYMDRIFAPEDIANLQKINNINLIKNLKCKHCKNLIGIPMIYEKENRFCFHLIQGSFIKKISKGEYPPAINKLE